MSADSKAQAPPEVVSTIRELLAAGRLAEARDVCAAASETYSDYELYELLGYISQQTQHYQDAVKACGAALGLGASGWSNHFVLGLSLSALHRHGDAAQSFGRALTFAPEREEIAVRFLDETFLHEGLDASRSVFREIARRNESASLVKAWARIAFEAGELSEATATGALACEQMTVRDWIEKNGGQVDLVGTVQQSPVVFPPVIGAEQESWSTSISSNQPYIAELTDVTIFYRSNIILTKDSAALDDVGCHPKFGKYVSHQSDSVVIGQRDSDLLLDAQAFPIDEIDTGIMLSGAASNEFGHWVCDFLPRMQVYEAHPDFSRLPVIVDDNMPASHYEYLSCVASNPQVRISPGRALRCKKLIFAPPVTFFPVHMLSNDFRSDEIVSMLPSSRRYLKQRVEECLGVRPSTGEKYYLSRRNMNWRRLSNDLEIGEFLAERGYTTINIETLSFVDQVRLFQSASSIVAANGAALLNVIFAEPSTGILVLTSPKLHDLPCFYGQIVPLGYRPIFVCGESIGDPDEKHADYWIPLEALERGLGALNELRVADV